MATDRTVAVRLKLQAAEFMAATRAAGASVKQLGKEMDTSARGGKKGMSELSKAAAVTGGGLLTMAGMAVKAFMDFDKQMSSVAAAGDEYAASLDKLRAVALQAGKDTKFSATEAAAGEEALAKAGVAAKDIIGGALTGALDLAAAGNLSVADSAEVAASAMVTFGLKGSDVTHVADVLAAAAGKAQGEVSDMAAGFRQSSAIAAQLGFSIEETAGALAMFANAGITGSDAGTSWKQAMLMMVAPTGKAASLMQDLGISFFDANGSMKSFSEIAGILQSKLGGLSQEQQGAALKTIFGADAYRVAAIAMKEGAAGADEWIAKVNDAGFAADVAGKKMDNLAGDFELLKGSLETALITTGSGGNAGLRDLTQGITGVVNAYLDLPAPVQQGVFWLTAASGAVIGGLGAYGMLAPKVKAGTDALAAMGPAGQKAARGVAVAGKAAGVALGAFVALEVAGTITKSIQDNMIGSTPGVERFSAAFQQLSEQGTAQGLDEIGVSMGRLQESLARLSDKSGQEKFTDAMQTPFEGIFGQAKSLEQATRDFAAVDAALTKMVSSGNAAAAADAISQIGMSAGDVKTLLPGYVEALQGSANAAGGAVIPTKDLAGATGDLAGELGGAAGEVKSLVDAWDELHGATLSADQSMLAAAEAVTAVKDAFKENGNAIKGNTEAALKNRIAVQEAVKAAVDARQKKLDEGSSVGSATAAYNLHIAALRGTLKAAHLTKGQIDALIATYASMPSAKSTTISTPGARQSTETVKTLNARIAALRGKIVQVRESGAAGSTARIAAMNREIDRLRSKRIDIVMNTTRLTSGPRKNKPMPNMADGGIVVRHAADGYLPQQAMVATPSMGTLYQWNEPETAGEAFIPLATSKRSRSKAIAETVVENFGGTVAWSNGGMTASQVVTSSGGGRVVAELHPADRALLRANANRPIQVRADLRTSNKILAHAVAEGQRDISRQG